MKTRWFGLVLCVFAVSSGAGPVAQGRTILVDPEASPAPPGVVATIPAALSLASPGDRIRVRGIPGHRYPPFQIRADRHRQGAQGRPIVLESVPGTMAVIDASRVPEHSPAALTVYGMSYWHIRRFEVDGISVDPLVFPSGQRARYKMGISVATQLSAEGRAQRASHHVVVEECVVHHCNSSGIQMAGVSASTVLNCDAFLNSDEFEASKGNNADGIQVFANRDVRVHVGTATGGNRVVGCRAWGNSDDGIDCFGNERVLILCCQALFNGHQQFPGMSEGFIGNGIGFKLGADGSGNTLVGSLAVGNLRDGVQTNNSAGGCRVYHCTAWGNPRHNFCMRFGRGQSERHLISNCLSLHGVHTVDPATADSVSNSWDLRYEFDPDDFVELPPASLEAFVPPPRVHGLLPPSAWWLTLTEAAAELCDTGTRSTPHPPGFFVGDAPDVGASEYVPGSGGAAAVHLRAGLRIGSRLRSYPVVHAFAALGTDELWLGNLRPSAATQVHPAERLTPLATTPLVLFDLETNERGGSPTTVQARASGAAGSDILDLTFDGW